MGGEYAKKALCGAFVSIKRKLLVLFLDARNVQIGLKPFVIIGLQLWVSIAAISLVGIYGGLPGAFCVALVTMLPMLRLMVKHENKVLADIQKPDGWISAS